MAGDSVKKLLMQFAVDSDAFDQAVKKARTTLSDFADEERQRAADSQKDQSAAIAAQKEQLKTYANVKGEASALGEIEKSRTATLKVQQEEIKKAALASKVAADAELASARLMTEAARIRQAELRVSADQQLALVRKSATEQQAAQRATAAEQTAAHRLRMAQLQEEAVMARRASGGGAGGLLSAEAQGALKRSAGGIFGSITGSGALGGLATGALTGSIIVVAIEAISKAIEALVEKFKELTIESGKLSQLKHTFDELAAGKGISDSAAFLQDLRDKTHNLVADTQLLTVANTFLQSHLKITQQDMLKLTEATVNLARANGKDAPAAMNALQRFYLTGRAMSLAMVTGIQRQEMMVRNLGSALDQTTKSQLQFNLASKVIEQKSAALGPTPITFAEALTGFENVRGRLIEAFGQGLTTSSGLGDFVKSLTTATTKVSTLTTSFEQFGSAVGEVFQTVGHIIDAFVKSFDAANQGLSDTSTLSGWDKAAQQISLSIVSLVGLMATLGHFVRQTVYEFKNLASAINVVGYSAEAMSPAGLLTPSYRKDALTRLAQNQQDMHSSKTDSDSEQAGYDSFMASLKDIKTQVQNQKPSDIGPVKTKSAILPGTTDPSSEARNERKLQQEKFSEQKTAAAEQLDATKENLTRLHEMYDDAYKQGLMSEDQYYKDRHALMLADYNAAVANAAKLRDLTLGNIDQLVKEGQLTPAQANMQKKIASDTYGKSVSTAQKTYDPGNYGVTKEQRTSDSGQAIDDITRELEARKAALQEEQQLTEYSFRQQQISSKDYFDQRIAQINGEVAAQKKASDEILKAKKANFTYTPKDLDDQNKALQTSLDAAKKQLQQMQQNLAQTILQGIQAPAQSNISSMQGRLAISQTGPAGESLAGAKPQDIQQQMKQAMQDQIAQLTQLLPQLQGMPEAWNQTYQAILKATQQLMDFNAQIQDSNSLLPMIGSIFGELSQQASGIFGSHYAKGLESAFSGIGRQLEAAPAINRTLRGGPASTLDPATQKALQPVLDSSASIGAAFAKTEGTFTQGNQEISSAISNLVQQLTLLANKIAMVAGGGTGEPLPGQLESSQAALQQAMTEGGPLNPRRTSFGPSANPTVTEQKPMTMGGDLASIFSGGGGGGPSISDAFKDLTTKTIALAQSFGSAISTIQNSGSASAGALAGVTGGASAGGAASTAMGLKGGAAEALTGSLAAVGLIVGLISGQKQEQVQSDINQLNETYKDMMDAFSSNNASLQATINNLQTLIAQAQADAANTKKPGSFNQMIISYQEQIASLQDQAQQTMTQLKEQLDVLSSPTPYQSMVSSIEQVVQQYAQFAGSAQNTEQLAQANQFLTGSLQQLAEGYSEQLLGDEENAVQQALQLNDLMNQRNQLQYQFLQQTESIMGQGTLTRNQTLAQSKYSQMYQASVSYSNQLMDINEQIAVAQAQVTAAQQVFTLATNRQALESQMVSLQTASIQLDMGRISAMANLLKVLQGSGYSILPGTATANNPNALILALMTALMGQLGNSSGSNQTNLINAIMAAMQGSASGSGSAGVSGSLSSVYALLGQMGLGGFSGVNL